MKKAKDKQKLKLYIYLSCIALAVLLLACLKTNIFLNLNQQENKKSNLSGYIFGYNLNFENTNQEEKKKKEEKALADSKQSVEERLNESKKLQAIISNSKNKTFFELFEVEQNISLTDAKINDTMIALEIINTNLMNAKNKLKVLDTAVKEADELVKKRLKAIYKNGKLKNIEILIASSNVFDLVSNYYMLQKISEIDNVMLKKAETNRKNAKIFTDEIIKMEKEYKEKLEELEKTKELNSYYVILKNSKLSKLNEDEKKVIKNIEELEKEKLLIEKEISQKTLLIPRIPKYVGGIFAWPVPSVGTNYITATYKQRGSYWSRGFHSGVDIAIPKAELGRHYAVAAQEGRVVVAVGDKNGSRVGYGNYVLIDHGGGIYTLYGHAEKVIVTPRSNGKKR